MKKSDGRSTSRLARVLGLIIVLGLPLAAVSPLDTGLNLSSPGSDGAAPGVPSAPSADPSLDSYEAATPAPPLPAFDSIEVRDSDPSTGADPVTTIVNDPRCGAGFTSTGPTGSSVFACFHSALDPLPELSQPVAQAKAAAPACVGNGVNGPRLQLVYMYVEGQPNRSAQVVPRIAGQIVPRMEGVFRETSKLQGREIGMRLHMPGCKLLVDTVKIDAENGAPDDPGAMLTRITEHLIETGYDSTDRKYIVWFDGGNKGACGIAPVNALPVLDDNPTQANRNNVGWQTTRHETAVIFRWGFPVLGDPQPPYPGAPAPPECWGRGGTGARTEIHELIHLLGAVQLSAPNSNGFGHCTDDHDIMCYGERGVSTIPRCATPVEQLDCGADDYFNARPPAGSYLSTHWNTANSRFLGPAIVHDAVPLEIPRP